MNILYSIFSNTIVAFVILIGIVIFAHELGHFLAGKLFGIRVEEFSIGFGPKAFGFKKGDTEYRINWLPLGGYVRFYGSDLDETIPEENQAQSLLHSKLYKRALVSFAGPFANFVLSFFIMTIMSWHGLPDSPSIVSVLPQSVAEKSHLQTGDKILSINGKETRGWSDLVKMIGQSAGQDLQFSIERQGKIQSIPVTPKLENAETVYGSREPQGRIGITPFFSKPSIAPIENDFFSTIGLHSGDEITSINQIETHYLYQVVQAIEKITQANSDSTLAQKINDSSLNNIHLNIILKNKKEIDISFKSQSLKNWARQSGTNSASPVPWKDNIVSDDQTVGSFQKGSQAWQTCGLKTGDTIRYIKGYGHIVSPIQISMWLNDISQTLTKNKTTGLVDVELSVTNSNGISKELACKVPVENGVNHLDLPTTHLNFPITFAAQPVMYPPILIESSSFLTSIQNGFDAFLRQMSLIYNGLKMLISGHIPLSNLGGPIAVAGIAGDAAKAGFVAFLITLSIISVNIGMVNLLPLPALDGGTLLLYLVEAFYGKPLPKKVQLTVQKIGIFIILFLFVLVFYNDILRLFRFS